MSVIQAANLHFESTSANRIVYTNEKINLISPNEIEIPQHLKVNGMNVKPTIQAAFLTANIAYAHANAAFNTANTALPNTSGVSFNGSLNFPTGLVGFGTTSPFTKTTSFVAARDPVVVNDGSYLGGGAYWDNAWKNTVNNQGGWVLRNTSGNLAIFAGTTGGVAGSTMATMPERMRIDNVSGNVLIGRTDSTVGNNVRLDVNGAVNASAILVNGTSSSFPSGTALLFQQTSAPTGWTKVTTHNDKALRVVSGAVGSGGTLAFTSAFASRSITGTVGATTLTTNQMPSHSHTFNGMPFLNLFHAGGANRPGELTTSTITTSSTGGGWSHDHTFTGTALNMDVQYVDVIIATKD